MNLQDAIMTAGSEDRSRRLLADFVRMGITATSPITDVGRRIEDPEVPWNVRAALLMTAAEAGLSAVADSLPSILKTLLERKLTFEELQVIESAWWMCGDFASRYPLADLTELADRSLTLAAKHQARNLDNILSAVAEAVVACELTKASDIMPTKAARWLSGLNPEWLHTLRAREVLTPDIERFHRLTTTKEMRESRRVLSDWLTKNVEPSPPPYSSPAAGSESGEA